jgi:hypothetical protein
MLRGLQHLLLRTLLLLLQQLQQLFLEMVR